MTGAPPHLAIVVSATAATGATAATELVLQQQCFGDTEREAGTETRDETSCRAAGGGSRAAAEAAVRALAFPAEICLESLAWARNSHAATGLGSRMALKRPQNLI